MCPTGHRITALCSFSDNLRRGRANYSKGYLGLEKSAEQNRATCWMHPTEYTSIADGAFLVLPLRPGRSFS